MDCLEFPMFFLANCIFSASYVYSHSRFKMHVSINLL
uniref:Uncharacterized protein n=1 Tax=Anguilla anguilla TaxID=7936 RepID=A0A0E9WAM0_ANGAN